jgi:hypothetical protein
MNLPMKINVLSIPQARHRFTTIGDWWVDGADTLQIRISEEISWQYQVAVLFHELIEFFICKAMGVGTEECDAFDLLFEHEYYIGKWPKSVEAGFDKRCPYRRGHIWGYRFERLTIWLLGDSWKDYCRVTDELMGVEQ